MRVPSIILLVAVSGCGADQRERHPMVQREIDACIAGMSGLVPDDKQRKIVCECTADATVQHQSDADAMSEAVAKCRDNAGLDPSDPFDILDGGGSKAAESGASTEYEEEPSNYDEAGYASEEEGANGEQ